MKLRCAILLFLCGVAYGQVTSVTLQVTDADGQTWNNGTWQAQLVSPPGVPGPPYNILGTSTPVPNQLQNGPLDGGGAGTLSVTPNTSIAPAGTVWSFQVCPLAIPWQCFTQQSSITGGSMTVTVTPPAIRINLNNPLLLVRAYQDFEIVTPVIGAMYYNLTTPVQRQWTGVGWVNVGSGGGGGGGSGTVSPGVGTQIAYYPSAGTVVAGASNFTDDLTTVSVAGNTYTSLNNTVDGIFNLAGAFYFDTLPAAGTLPSAPAGRSSMGVNTDGNFYISANSTAISPICTPANGLCGGTPAGTTGQFQYNNAGAFGGTTGFTWNSSTREVNLNNTNGTLHFWPQDPTGNIPLIRLDSPTGHSSIGFASAGVDDFNIYHYTSAQQLAISERDLSGVDVLGITGGITTLRDLWLGQPANSVSGHVRFQGGTSGNCNQSVNATATQITFDCPIIATNFNFPSVQQFGDTLRYNVNGDNAWDAVNSAPVNFLTVNFIPGGTCSSGTVFTASTVTSAAPQTEQGVVCTTVYGTNTIPNGMKYSSNATAYALGAIGLTLPQNGNNSLLPIRAWIRMSFLMSISPVANTRYYFGLTTWYSASIIGTNSTAILGLPTPSGTLKYFTDSPTSNTIGFRYSAGTDTHWQAVAITAGGGSTITDTGITPDTNPHSFDVAMNSTGTSLNYLIDNTVVATISTNIPPAAPTNPIDGLASIFATGDNKNTNTACAFTLYSIRLALR